MDLRTFRRNGPGLAECESQAAWHRLWGERRAHRSLNTREHERGRILATIWIPGANPFNVVRGARGKSLWLPELGFEGHMKWAKAMP